MTPVIAPVLGAVGAIFSCFRGYMATDVGFARPKLAQTAEVGHVWSVDGALMGTIIRRP